MSCVRPADTPIQVSAASAGPVAQVNRARCLTLLRAPGRDERRDDRPRALEIPVGAAHEAGDFLALAVEHDRDGQAGHVHGAGDGAFDAKKTKRLGETVQGG